MSIESRDRNLSWRSPCELARKDNRDRIESSQIDCDRRSLSGNSAPS